jgi:predicted ATPase
VLASRIDRLPAEDKELLQTLAVLGREFRLGLVRRVTLRADDELEHRLAGLQAGEFIYEQPATGDVEYTFKHALTFGTTPKEQLDSYKAAVWCYLLEHSDLQEKRRALLKFHTDDRWKFAHHRGDPVAKNETHLEKRFERERKKWQAKVRYLRNRIRGQRMSLGDVGHHHEVFLLKRDD